MTRAGPPPRRDLARSTLAVIGILALIAGCLLVLRPFLGALLWACMIVVSTWPLRLAVERRLGGRRAAAAAVMTVALLLVLFIPLLGAVATIVGESHRIAELARLLPALQLPPPPPWMDAVPFIGPRAAARWQELAALPHDRLVDLITPYLSSGLAWFAARAGGIGGMVLEFVLTVVVSAILYARGEAAAGTVRRFFHRLSDERGDAMVALAGKAIRAVALGVVVTAALQTAVAGAGLAAVGVPFAAFLSAVVLVLCIAQLGALPVLAPAVIWLYATGSPGRGTVLLVAALVTQAIDSVVRPVLIKKGADLSLLLVFPGVIGGLLWLGVIGLFVGPVILAVAANLLQGWLADDLGRPPAPGGGPALSD